MALFIKIVGALFFAYLGVDAWMKRRKLQEEIDDDLLNPLTGKILRRRALRNSMLFIILAVLSFISVFFRVAPLGE
jgi:threonine/homoserine/homoserine lactone efflux protein